MRGKLALLIAVVLGLMWLIPSTQALSRSVPWGEGAPPPPRHEMHSPLSQTAESIPPANAPTSALSSTVSLPIQLTSDVHYERGESITYDGTDYWLFYGRSSSFTGTYATGNPDINDYQVYYKKAPSIAGLAAATPALITGVAHNQDSFLGETGAAYFDGEVWAFATVVSGTSASLYGWYTQDGTTWTEVGPVLTGLSAGQAHHDEIAFDGELWVLEGSGNFTTMHSSTPKTGGWSTPLSVDNALTGGLAHFYAEGDTLYLAIYSNGSNYIYRYNADAVAWEQVDAISPPEKYDPTLFKVGERYVFAQAPWVNPRQYIIAWSNSTLDDTFFDNGYHLVTEGEYGSNPWVDMWPIGFTTAEGESYLFFTSERNPADPATETDGNIWYLKVDWDLALDHYTYIQEAVNAAGDHATIGIAGGTYVEQVEITKSLTLSGSGIGETIIQSPYTLSLKFTTSADNYPIIYVHDITATTIQGLTVDGAGRGNNNVRFEGIAFRNAGGTVASVEVKEVRDTPFSGVQHGVAIYVFNSDGITRTIQVHDSHFSGFQKNAMALNALSTALAVDVRGNTIVGHGATTVTAQNGIQVWAAEGYGTIADNTISAIAYDNTDDSIKWVATSILNYLADLTITGNTISGTHMGIYNYDGSAQIGENRISVEKVGVEAWGIVASDPPDAVPAPFGEADPLRPTPSGVESVLSTLTVGIFSNTLSFSGTVHTATHGIEADAGFGDDNLAFTATHNIVQGFEAGIEFLQCEESCGSGIFTVAFATRNCLIENDYGMRSNVPAFTIQAEGNYWGDYTGPYHPTLNPRGQGDAVSDGIDFDPWSLICGGGPIQRTFMPLILRNH